MRGKHSYYDAHATRRGGLAGRVEAENAINAIQGGTAGDGHTIRPLGLREHSTVSDFTKAIAGLFGGLEGKLGGEGMKFYSAFLTLLLVVLIAAAVHEILYPVYGYDLVRIERSSGVKEVMAGLEKDWIRWEKVSWVYLGRSSLTKTASAPFDKGESDMNLSLIKQGLGTINTTPVVTIAWHVLLLHICAIFLCAAGVIVLSNGLQSRKREN